ncbi:hypothetical protein QNO00_05115 [Arthrobacter sp. zg-Y1219]|uniref:hypothetical protein n=1 Tax=Arthrobacter sp. zg-Y1219 TaxID=3049067 RepID=UPI0024C3351E|nr:hypothetical protein [Arthrobacter sp. zg-Y1219]MDK1359645.1 hypothetical protein [Arthrobacter sp. zg-Y1219]
MSGRRSNKQRQATRERPAHLVSADIVLRSADAVLSVDLSEVPLSHVNQFAVGWMRAAFEQSRVIAKLTKMGMGHSAAPNRRAFWELAVRLLWFADMAQSEREKAADTMLDQGRSTEKTTHNHMQAMGVPSNIDIAAMEEFVLAPSKEKAMQQQAKDLTAAVNAMEQNLGAIYRLWREDSTWTHASGFLAGRYAPAESDDKIGVGAPPAVDRDLEAHRIASMAIVVSAGYILAEEGVPSDLASAAAVAFHQVT